MHRFLFALFVALLSAVAVQAQDWAKARLEKSPRHGEWVKVKQGQRDVQSFLVYPEVKEKATAVVVIHEIFGLTDWVRSLADELAEAGYIAIAPNLVPGLKEGENFENLRKAISEVPPEQITADLNAVARYVAELPSCNGKVVVCGFCWGGGQAFRFATNNKDIKAAYVFYGSPPTKGRDIDESALERITCPVYGFYGERDNRINATIPQTKELMKKAGKTYEPVIYDGAGHGFMRAGEAPDANEANKKARDDAWKRWKELLKKV
jgi:carboxymethylenebutenolidase